MSPTVKSAALAVLCAAAGAQSAASVSATSARPARLAPPRESALGAPAARCEGFMTRSEGRARSTELARNVVVERDTHQEDEQRDAQLLPERLSALGQRASRQPLDDLKQDLPPVEDRDRQQVEEAQRQGDQHQEAEKRRDARLRRLAGELRDRQRAAQP